MSHLFDALVNGTILSGALTTVVWIVLRLRASAGWNAATRYAVWCAVLLASILMTVLCLPIRTQRPAAVSSASSTKLAEKVAAVPAAGTAKAFLPDVPVDDGSLPLFVIRVLPPAWTARIAWLWLIAGAFMLARLAASYVLLEIRRRRAVPLAGESAARLVDLLRETGMRRHVRILVSNEVRTPMALGPHRPCIVLPETLIGALDEADLEQTVLHENAHLNRRDDYALIFERILQALFVLHPVVHWISRRLDIEREIACDDIVLAAKREAPLYALCLTRVAELSGRVKESPLGAFAVARTALEKRIELLLDSNRNVSAGVMKLRFAMLLCFLTLLAATGLWSPRPVMFGAVPAVPRSQAVAPEVNVQVIVTDPLGRYVSGLQREQFKLFEDGVEQSLTQFSPDGPLSTCIVADIDDSAGDRDLIMRAAQRALRTNVAGDEFCLVETVNPPQVTVPFTADTRNIETRLNAGRPAASASLIAGIEVAMTALRSSRNFLKLVLIVSNRGPAIPQYSAEEMRALTGVADAPVYILTSMGNSPAFEEIASATGGRQVSIRTTEDADTLGARPLIGARNSYLLGFRPLKQLGDGTFHKLEVQYVPIRGLPRLNMTFRAGYIAR